MHYKKQLFIFLKKEQLVNLWVIKTLINIRKYPKINTYVKKTSVFHLFEIKIYHFEVIKNCCVK